MRRKQLFITSTIIFSSIILIACGCKNNVTSISNIEQQSTQQSETEHPSESESIEVTESIVESSTFTEQNEESSISEDSVLSEIESNNESESNSIVMTAFLAPKNVRIEEEIITWEDVDNATNGYTVKVKDNNGNYNTIKVDDNYIALEDINNTIERGVYKISIHTNADEYHYVSPYSSEIEYLYGARYDLINQLITDINNISFESPTIIEDIDKARNAYNQLDYIDKMDHSAKDAIASFANIEGKYILNIVNNSINDDNKISECKEYYDTIIFKDNCYVKEALNIIVSYSLTYVQINTINGTQFIVFPKGNNFLGSSIDIKKVTINNEEKALNNGKVAINSNESFKVYFNNDYYQTIEFAEKIDDTVEDVSGNNVYNISSSIDSFMVLVFKKGAVSMNNNQIDINGLLLTSFEIDSNILPNKIIASKCLEDGIKENEVSVIIVPSKDGLDGNAYTNDKLMNINLISNCTSLDSPYDIDKMEMTFDEEGNLSYRWEILLNNEEFLNNVCSGASFDFFSADKEAIDCSDDVLASIKINNSGFLTKNMITSALMENGIESNVPLKVGVKMISNYPDLLDSKYNYANNSYTYVLDYRLPTYQSSNFFLRDSGELTWYYEMFMESNNPLAKEISYFEVWILPSSVNDICLEDENNEEKVVAKFAVKYENGKGSSSNKDTIESILSLNNQDTGEYHFTGRFIPVEGSKYNCSNLAPLTESFTYTVPDVSNVNIAKDCIVYSSIENDNNKASNICDGNHYTDWKATESNPAESPDIAWIIIDLGNEYSLRNISIYWEGAYAKSYEVLTCVDYDKSTLDFSLWNVVFNDENCLERRDDSIDLTNITARYIAINCLEKGFKPYAFTIHEVEVYRNK